MFLWPIYGISKYYTKKKVDLTSGKTNTLMHKCFKKSMHVFAIDVGCDNELTLEFYSLLSPKYNTHRFGIFFTNTPKHADLLAILSRPTQMMVDPLLEAINQMPQPFGVMLLENSDIGIPFETLNIPNVVAHLKGNIDAQTILSTMLSIMGRW